MNVVEKNKLISLLNKVINQIGKQTSDHQICYVCPFHNALNHLYKKKFGINLDTFEYNCFACGESGKSLKSLFKKLKAKPSQYKELYAIIGEKPVYYKRQKKEEKNELQLPIEFQSLCVYSKSIHYKNALNYVLKRGISNEDILRYNIGYCEYGIYKNRIIIPSYDGDANLNFFSARDFYGTSSLKYLFPKWSKDIIGFELFINWNDPDGIVLCEGPFDAISIRKNAIPLFGKVMSNSLKEQILENDVKIVNICLDMDAISDSIKLCNYLSSYNIEARLVKLDDKDPSEIGFERITNIINSSNKLDFSELMFLKIKNNI